MTTSNTDERPLPILHARLTPHRSLGRAGFRLVMLALVIPSLAIGAIFLSRGAWPVTGFLGLDVAALWLAFRRNYWSAREIEHVVVGYDDVLHARLDARGGYTENHFNPLWVRLRVEYRGHDDFRHVSRLQLGMRERWVAVGAFLNPPDKASFAEALSAALATARAGRRFGSAPG